MATLSMKKLRLIGLVEEKDALVDLLCRLGCVEVKKPPVIEHTSDRQFDTSARDKTADKISRLNAAINFVDEQSKEMAAIAKKQKDKAFVPPKKIFLGGKWEVSDGKFFSITENEGQIFDEIVAPSEKMSARLKELVSQITALKARIRELKLYKDVEINASNIKSTANSSIVLGSIAVSAAGKAVKEQAKEAKKKYSDIIKMLSDKFLQAQFTLVGKLTAEKEGKKQKPNAKAIELAILYACVPTDTQVIAKTLEGFGFKNAAFDFEISPRTKYDELVFELKKYEDEKAELMQTVFKFNDRILDTKILYDNLSLQLQKIELENKLVFTDTVFVLDGFVPEVAREGLSKALKAASSNIEVEFSEPSEKETLPTMTRNGKLVAPYEFITNMFSVPNAREIDPNRFVAFFYCLLFGMMLGDAGYGIVITLGCWLALRLLKPVGGKKLVQVIMMGGVSTIFWGIMFGGWFGIQGLENTILRPYLLSPMNNPLEMLGLSIGIGLFQILFGMGISMAQKFKNGRAIDALLDILPWHIFFLGIILMVVSMLLGFDLGGIPTYLMIAALAVIVLFGGRSKKGIAGKILGGLSGLYKVVGFLSDLLSYSRLFGLALAGGVIAMVFNLLGGLLMGSIISIPFAIVIFLVGHIFNIAINLLGTYVHDSRLQYIEFFSRFYEGEGYLFAPLGSVTRYTTIIPEKSIMDFSKKTAQATTELLTNDN